MVIPAILSVDRDLPVLKIAITTSAFSLVMDRNSVSVTAPKLVITGSLESSFRLLLVKAKTTIRFGVN